MKPTFFILTAALVGLIVTPGAAPVEVRVSAPTRLRQLERKANEYEVYRARYMELQSTLDEMLSLLGVDEENISQEVGKGRLADLLEKAARSNTLTKENDHLRKENQRLAKRNEELLIEVEKLKANHAGAEEQIAATEKVRDEWKKKAEGMRETIDRLLLGQFEYYEVKEGDTLQGIAADEMIYGDPARAVWLRQANQSRVPRLENLTPGEMLIVPRFPNGGTYEF